MRYEVQVLREVYRLFRSSDRSETVLAVVLVAVVAGPVCMQYARSCGLKLRNFQPEISLKNSD